MKKKWGTLAIVLLAAASMLAGCGESSYEAAPVNEETDKCETCNMQVKDDAYAVQLLTNEGKVYKFDDIGCMNEWKTKNGTEQIKIEFVRDQESGKWIELNKAYFAYDPAFKTPMAYGLVSFNDKAAAERYVQQQGKGKVLAAADLKSHTWERHKDGMKMDKHEKDAHMQTDMKGTKH